MYKAFFYITLFLGIIPLLILFIKRKAFLFKEPIAPFVWLTALATLYEFIGSVVLQINTAYWFQVYSFLELTALFYFFFKLYAISYKRTLLIFASILILTYGLSFLFWNENSQFIVKAINKAPLTLFVCFFSFVWFKNLFEEAKILNPWREPTFCFVSGFAMYYSTTLFLFLLGSFFFVNEIYFYDYWLVNIVATFMLRIFLIMGVWNMKQA